MRAPSSWKLCSRSELQERDRQGPTPKVFSWSAAPEAACHSLSFREASVCFGFKIHFPGGGDRIKTGDFTEHQRPLPTRSQNGIKLNCRRLPHTADHTSGHTSSGCGKTTQGGDVRVSVAADSAGTSVIFHPGPRGLERQEAPSCSHGSRIYLSPPKARKGKFRKRDSSCRERERRPTKFLEAVDTQLPEAELGEVTLKRGTEPHAGAETQSPLAPGRQRS